MYGNQTNMYGGPVPFSTELRSTQTAKRRQIEFEVIGTANPFTLSVQGISTNILGVDLEKFYYDMGGMAVRMIGIVMQGARGRYNENCVETQVLKTIPNQANIFNYQATDEDYDSHYLYSNGTDIQIAFVSRDGGSLVSGLNAPLITFSQNYLLNLSLIVEDF